MGRRGPLPKKDAARRARPPGARKPAVKKPAAKESTAKKKTSPAADEPATSPAAAAPGGPSASVPDLPAEWKPPAGLAWRELATWYEVLPALLDLGNLLEVDRPAVIDYVTCLSRMRECEADVSTRGTLVQGQRGPVKNPAVQLARDYRISVQRWAAELGATPASRVRQDVKEPTPADGSSPYFDQLAEYHAERDAEIRARAQAAQPETSGAGELAAAGDASTIADDGGNDGGA